MSKNQGLVDQINKMWPMSGLPEDRIPRGRISKIAFLEKVLGQKLKLSQLHPDSCNGNCDSCPHCDSPPKG